MTDEVAIRAQNVHKNFKLPHDKTHSLKGAFLKRVRGGRGSFEMQHALEDVTFDVHKGEFFGIVGRNGSGKSTLLKVLAEIYKPTEGGVQLNGKLVPFIELGVGFNPELTGRDNVYLSATLLGFSRKAVDAMYKDIVEFAELEKFMDQKLKNYSSGMQVRLAFSVATRAKADILLIDEVLAVGDTDFQRKCFNYFRQLKDEGRTIVFVSHDMGAVREFCDRALLINAGKVEFLGNVERAADEYERLNAPKNPRQAVRADNPKEISNRWGDGAVRITSVDTDKKSYTGKSEAIELSVALQAKQDVSNVVSGFRLVDSKGADILGSNTLVAEKEIAELKNNKKLTIHWTIPNILAPGTYRIVASASHNRGRDTADFIEEAATLRVSRVNASPHLVSPPITAELSG